MLFYTYNYKKYPMITLTQPGYNTTRVKKDHNRLGNTGLQFETKKTHCAAVK